MLIGEVFTGTVPLYAIDYEGWFGELISSFKANTEYTYQLYLKLTDEAAAQGYVFGPNTKLKVNGKMLNIRTLVEPVLHYSLEPT